MNVPEGVLEVYREPRRSSRAPHGWTYARADLLRPPARVTPLAAPDARIPIADLLP